MIPWPARLRARLLPLVDRQQRLEVQGVLQHGDVALSIRGGAEYGTSQQLEVNCTARGTPYRHSLRQTDP